MPRQSAAVTRCPWSEKGNDLYLSYHDAEWGVPVWDDKMQFEFLILEGAQAGLSWSTILNKREGYRAAFAGFDPERIARFGKREVARLMKDPGIVRNRLKVESAISNARAYLKFQEEEGDFARHLWAFVGGKPIQNRFTEQKQVPATSPESDAISRDLKKRGFRFVGSTIIYAHMQATGMVNDHILGCFRYRQCRDLGKKR
jgi:DNA-3-methyladenine glycosylase I